MKLVGHERPSTLPGPDGTVSVLGIVFEGDEATIDNGALHNRSHLEVGIKFSEDPAARGKGERIGTVWVAYPGVIAERYHGVVTAEVWVDRATGTGWKRPLDHVNRMTMAVRGKIEVAELSLAQRQSLARVLATYASRAWDASSPELRQALS